ncbi:MAG: ATP-dependent zinc metalloprotease FtsH [Candidatus Eremiobacteraeota bacterium]|nr:ATP-dependent zinc metalloprotease FtsH [Candidatus Eremiobacteraeota bacterium]MBV8262619.1 ATP-dependent zinc metalloprotease FtsH [Candidatus Eremiobacteraeota bacterium]MBV8459862.1 ATP-dependent zinc metalloprotease FtsH [Candidatus Eremiobacteraeota bacterium]MBV8595602.1 ATP-dependent zinc metalloprotease FtsH [Candidatus Eremiobacteraeota bacterium]MBV8669401.1 ATP-dependent zinc metalloprotease FtsH [Candidatus Eremiobacteraeota bacterium]
MLAIVLTVAYTYYQRTVPQQRAESYSELLTQINSSPESISEVEVGPSSATVKLVGDTPPKTIQIPPGANADLVKVLIAHKVKVYADNASANAGISMTIIYWVIPLFFGVAILMIIARQLQSGGSQALSFGRSRAKLLTENRPKVTFADVAGVDEAKQELGEVVEFLKYPKKFQQLGARIPKGLLLLGPPGSGKTLLARAIAGEAGVPFFSISGSDFVEMFVGVGASRVRDLFEQAKKSAPCIVFIDEIDAVGRQRGAGLGGGHDEREQTLNQLLVEMDGFDVNTGVILIAATNRPDVLDPALLRPGRFDRQVVVDRADVVGRAQILAVHARNKPLAPDVRLEVLARRTPGFSGADLENLLNEAALLAARQNKTQIDMRDCEEAIDRVLAGPERKSRIMSQREKELVAYHESGHALTAKLLPNADPLHKVTIIPRGMALGITMQLPTEDRYLMTKAEIVDRIMVLLGARASEELIFQENTTGAHDDLQKATSLARKMVMEFGMSPKIGPIALGKKHEQVFLGRDIVEERNYSEEVASQIDTEVRGIIDTCYANAYHLLETNIDKLHRLAEALLDKETIEADEVERLLSDNPAPAKTPSTPEENIPERAAAASTTPKEEKVRVSPPSVLPFPPPEPA